MAFMLVAEYPRSANSARAAPRISARVSAACLARRFAMVADSYLTYVQVT